MKNKTDLRCETVLLYLQSLNYRTKPTKNKGVYNYKYKDRHLQQREQKINLGTNDVIISYSQIEKAFNLESYQTSRILKALEDQGLIKLTKVYKQKGTHVTKEIIGTIVNVIPSVVLVEKKEQKKFATPRPLIKQGFQDILATRNKLVYFLEQTDVTSSNIISNGSNIKSNDCNIFNKENKKIKSNLENSHNDKPKKSKVPAFDFVPKEKKAPKADRSLVSSLDKQANVANKYLQEYNKMTQEEQEQYQNMVYTLRTMCTISNGIQKMIFINSILKQFWDKKITLERLEMFIEKVQEIRGNHYIENRHIYDWYGLFNRYCARIGTKA
jgi:hypothetical protein